VDSVYSVHDCSRQLKAFNEAEMGQRMGWMEMVMLWGTLGMKRKNKLTIFGDGILCVRFDSKEITSKSK